MSEKTYPPFEEIVADACSDSVTNTGHFSSPRWTCCACYAELGDIGEGDHDCPSCGAPITCSLNYTPSYATDLRNPHKEG